METTTIETVNLDMPDACFKSLIGISSVFFNQGHQPQTSFSLVYQFFLEAIIFLWVNIGG